MSLSKVARNCVFCKTGSGIYTCPRCSKKYCSSYCYKCRAHSECSEAFYKNWVEESLSSKSSDPADKENMLRILKEFESASADDPINSEPSMEERFSTLNIDEADEDVIWQHLNSEEKLKFKAFIEDEKNIQTIVSLKEPWWNKSTLCLVSEDSDVPDNEGDISPRPPYPLGAKKLSELTAAKPSSCIQNNLVNVLYSYAYLCHFYNGDLRDFLGEVVKLIFTFSPVLYEDHNYSSLEEALQDSIRRISDFDPKVPVGFIKSIVNDVAVILQGPTNSRLSTFVVCALHEIKLLLLEHKENSKPSKSMKQRLHLVVKKIEYYIGWSLEYEDALKIISSDITLVMLPDFMPGSDKTVENNSFEPPKIPLIEEIN